MAMKSLALSKEEAKAQYDCCAPEGDDTGPKYPWGTSLCLGTEALEKLGLGLMPVGTEVTIIAKGKITGTSSRERQDGEPTQDMDVQLTAIDLTAAQAESMADRQSRAAKRMYPDAD